MSTPTVEQVHQGKNVRHWRTGGVTVRESALFPRIYTCLTCHSNDCRHVDAVREFDAAEVTT